MTDIPIQVIGYLGSIAAVSFTAGDSSNDHDFDNSGNDILWVQNEGGGAVEVTIVSVADQYGRTGDIVMSISAAGRGVAGPFPQTLFNQSGGRRCNVLLDQDTSVTLAVIRFDPRVNI